MGKVVWVLRLFERVKIFVTLIKTLGCLLRCSFELFVLANIGSRVPPLRAATVLIATDPEVRLGSWSHARDKPGLVA